MGKKAAAIAADDLLLAVHLKAQIEELTDSNQALEDHVSQRPSRLMLKP